MIPFDTVTIVDLELMVEVVIAFSMSQDRYKPRIPCGDFFGISLFSQRMAKRVYKEGALLSQGNTQASCDYQTTERRAHHPTHQGWKGETS